MVMCKALITSFIEQALSFFSVVSESIGEREWEAGELSQPDKNHQKGKEIIFYWIPTYTKKRD